MTEGAPSFHSSILTLDLSRQSLAAAALEPLLGCAARGALPALLSLNLTHNPLLLGHSAAGCGVISELPLGRGGWHLGTLRLAHTHVGDRGAALLAEAVGSAPALHTLDLRYNEPPL